MNILVVLEHFGCTGTFWLYWNILVVLEHFGFICDRVGQIIVVQQQIVPERHGQVV
jgi:hypothetical protein